MANSNNATGNGLGFGSVLGIVFIVLKLCGVIDWSWWWVLCPFWLPIALIGFIVTIGLIVHIVSD